jgi:hypothetical protein
MKLCSTVFAAALLVAGSAVADETITVQSLAKDGYVVASGWMSQIGPALVLQKGEQVYLCFVREQPGNPIILTNYCKSVR